MHVYCYRSVSCFPRNVHLVLLGKKSSLCVSGCMYGDFLHTVKHSDQAAPLLLVSVLCKYTMIHPFHTDIYLVGIYFCRTDSSWTIMIQYPVSLLHSLWQQYNSTTFLTGYIPNQEKEQILYCCQACRNPHV